MLTFIFTFFAAVFACILALSFWDPIELLVMRIGEIMDDFREDFVHPGNEGRHLVTIRPVAIGVIAISFVVALIATL